MLGAIIGDIVGSRFEFDNIKTKKFDLFHRSCDFTDDTVMTLAVGKALIGQKPLEAPEAFKKHLVETMHEVGGRYPYCGYGGNFVEWIMRRRTVQQLRQRLGNESVGGRLGGGFAQGGRGNRKADCGGFAQPPGGDQGSAGCGGFDIPCKMGKGQGRD